MELSFYINEDILYNIENYDSPDITVHNKILLSFYECLKIIWESEMKEISINDDINGNYQIIENFLEQHIFGQELNEYSLEMNILLYSTEDLPFQDTKTHSIMKTILNIIILSKCIDIICAQTSGSIGAFVLKNGYRFSKVYYLGYYS